MKALALSLGIFSLGFVIYWDITRNIIPSQASEGGDVEQRAKYLSENRVYEKQKERMDIDYYKEAKMVRMPPQGNPIAKDWEDDDKYTGIEGYESLEATSRGGVFAPGGALNRGGKGKHPLEALGRFIFGVEEE